MSIFMVDALMKLGGADADVAFQAVIQRTIRVEAETFEQACEYARSFYGYMWGNGSDISCSRAELTLPILRKEGEAYTLRSATGEVVNTTAFPV